MWLPPWLTNWTAPSVVSIGTCALRSAAIASPSAFRTVALAVFSPNGVITGWASSNGWENGDGDAPLSKFQNSPNRTAPRWSASHRMFQRASVVHASPRDTVPPLEVGAVPPAAWNLPHSLTRAGRVSWAA